MKIAQIIAREIYDSRGFPTLECQIVLDNDRSVIASVPSGASKGAHEAFELRDGGSRLFGKGVLKAIECIEKKIAPELLFKKPDLFKADEFLLNLDGTEQKKKLGANTMLAVSQAIVKAQAVVENMELYELLAHLYGAESISLPYPLFNVINGGAHANNGLRIQEFMIVPVKGNNFREAMELGVTFFHELQKSLQAAGKNISVGDEGGFGAAFDDEMEALDFMVDIISKIGDGDQFAIAIDVAASQFYDKKTRCYQWHDDFLTAEELIKFYINLVEAYPIYSIEDGLDQDDWQGWVALNQALGSKIQLVGDDLFASSVARIKHGILMGAANTALIKPNQLGTVSESLYAIKECVNDQMNVIISHRSGETEDSFIADLTVATSVGQIKAGGCSRSENLAKYNRLLRIEDRLTGTLLTEF